MLPRHRHHHAHRRPHIPTPSPGCGHTCLDPLIPQNGSPCGCVHPLKVRILLTVPVYHVLVKIRELAHEIAAGTHLIPSQVQVVGASIDTKDPERTVVDINLVPLAKDFGTTIATRIAHRFLRGEVPLHKALFGTYKVVFIVYPGGPPGATSKKHKMSTRVVLNIVLHSFIACLACSAAVYISMRCWKARKESNAVGPVFVPPLTKKTGTGSGSSSSVASSTSLPQLTSMHTSALSMRTFSLAELEKATERFSSKRMLGAGGFGKVYHGSLEDGTEVAVKLLTRDVRSGDREFIAEAMVLSRLHHRNLVKLIGICIERRRRCLVYELIHNGNLDSHLHGSEKERRTLDWTERMKIAIGAARGLAYLHEDSNPRVIHRDVKSSNVLLEEDFTPKVSDFGLAREATDGSRHVSTRVMGTFGYVAPEYAMTGHLLVKSDVYSYGVVLLELLSGRKPVDMSQPDGDGSLVTWARPLLTTKQGIQKLVDPSLSGTCAFDDICKVAALAASCIHPDVSRRPFMGEVVQSLKLVYNDAGETCPDCTPRSASSSPGLDFRSGFVTMDFTGSARLGPLSVSSFRVERTTLPLELTNSSGPLMMIRSKPHYERLRGAVSERGRRNDAFWAWT